jgi:hypothetical protein
MARKTARQKAQEDLDLANRVLDKAEKRAARANEDLKTSEERYAGLLKAKQEEADTANADLRDAQDRAKFLASHPALKDDTLL